MTLVYSHCGVTALTNDSGIPSHGIPGLTDAIVVNVDMSWYRIKGRTKGIGLYWCVKTSPKNRDQWEHKLQALGWPQ